MCVRVHSHARIGAWGRTERRTRARTRGASSSFSAQHPVCDRLKALLSLLAEDGQGQLDQKCVLGRKKAAMRYIDIRI